MNGRKTVEVHHPHFHPPWVQRAHIQKYHAYACTNKPLNYTDSTAIASGSIAIRDIL
jgi:hypothetical protein